MGIAGSLIWEFFKIKKVKVSGELGQLQRQNERLNCAQRLLETTLRSMENLALATAFARASAMRSHFKNRFCFSSSEWPKNFKL